MGENTDMQRSWNSTRRPDADIDLLQRSISHVEHLLDRLEYGAAVVPHEARTRVDTDEAEGIGAGTHPKAVTAGEQLHTDAASAASRRPDELRLAAQREAEATMRAARNWANEHCAIAEAEARRRLDAAERDAEQIRQTARELAHAETSQQLEHEIRTAVAKAVSDVDTARALAHSTLSVASASLANALERLQQLATALEADAAAPTGVPTETQALGDQPDDSGHGARVDAGVLGALSGSVAESGRAGDFGGVLKASRPIGTCFRPTRP